MAIKYIDPSLGERTLLVFSLEEHQQELARLKKLGYEITHPIQDDVTPVMALYIFQKLDAPGRFFDSAARTYKEACQLLIDSGETLDEWRLWR